MIGRRLAVAAAVVITVGVVSTGCAVTSGPAPHQSYAYPYTTDILDESRASATAPGEFLERDPLPPCPDIALKQGDEIPADAIACIEDAGSEGAELGVVRPTTEGDPYVSFYRVGPGIEGIEIWEDGTRDAFGGGWHLATCSEISVLMPDGCDYQDF